MSWMVKGVLIFLFISFIIALIQVISDNIKELPTENAPLSPSQESGWVAQLSKRGLKPAQNVHLGIMDEGDAVKSILQMGYRPEDIKSLEYLQ